MNTIGIHVECDANDSDQTTPRRLHFGKRVIEVEQILDRWYGADHCYMKLSGSDGGLYIVRHDVASGRWEVTFYDRRGPETSSHRPLP